MPFAAIGNPKEAAQSAGDHKLSINVFQADEEKLVAKAKR
jgi:hypothetical protein